MLTKPLYLLAALQPLSLYLSALQINSIQKIILIISFDEIYSLVNSN